MKTNEQPRPSPLATRKPGSKDRSAGKSAISISLDEELEEAFRLSAKEEGRNLSEWARFHLRRIAEPHLAR